MQAKLCQSSRLTYSVVIYTQLEIENCCRIIQNRQPQCSVALKLCGGLESRDDRSRPHQHPLVQLPGVEPVIGHWLPMVMATQVRVWLHLLQCTRTNAALRTNLPPWDHPEEGVLNPVLYKYIVHLLNIFQSPMPGKWVSGYFVVCKCFDNFFLPPTIPAQSQLSFTKDS